MFTNNSIFVECDQVCRLCLSGTVELQRIFSENGTNTIADILKTLTSISIVEDDGMPQKICTLCVHQANSAHYFILKCKETDRLLKQDFLVATSKDAGSLIGLMDFEVDDDPNGKKYNIDPLHSDDCAEMDEMYAIEVQELQEVCDADLELVCDHCTETFNQEAELRRHMNERHPIRATEIEEKPLIDTETSQSQPETDNQMPYECANCDKKFRRLQLFKKHIRIHNGLKFICELCGKSYDSDGHLKRHLNEVHEPEKSDAKFKCTVCGKEMKRLNHFTVHMRTHRVTADEPSASDQKEDDLTKKIKFPCTKCNKLCSSRSNLAVHMRRHSGQMTKFCTVCGKGYPRSTDLTIHMRKHTGEKPFICHVCNRSFARSDKLTIHMRVHTGEKPYGCKNCGRAFAQSNDLASHRRRNVCGKTEPVDFN